jgi:ABC-type transport system substrate-binding protein
MMIEIMTEHMTKHNGLRVCCLLLSVCCFLSGCAVLFPYDSPSPTPSPAALQATLPPLPGAPTNEVFGLGWQPVDWVDPIRGDNRLNREWGSLVYESLFSLNPEFEPVGVLCGAIESNEAYTSFTITLIPAVFHDGKPLSSADVVYSLRQAQSSGSPYRRRLSAISGITVINDETVRIQTSAPAPRLAALLDIPIVPNAALTGGGEHSLGPPGTGPYRISRDDSRVYLVRTDDPRQQGNYPSERIELITADSPEKLSDSFESAMIRMVRHDPLDTNAADIGGLYDRFPIDTTIFHYVGFNFRSQPLSNPMMRKLLAAIPNRSDIADEAMEGLAAVTVLPVPPSSPLYDEAAAAVLQVEFSQLLQWITDLGLEDINNDGFFDYRGRPLSLDFIVNSDSPSKMLAARRLAAQWGRLGIRVEVRALQWDEFQAETAAGNFDLYYAETRLTADFSLRPLLASNGDLNFGRYTSWGNQYAVTPQAMMRFVEEVPIIPLWFRQQVLLSRQGQYQNAKPGFEQLYWSLLDWD